jgi:cysteine-rich repeat protein
MVDEAHEKCDDGVNLSPYGGCAAGCILPTCGDGIVQAAEQCDDMVLDGKYGGCTAQCLLAPHCGDGVVQADQGEQCDDGNRVSGDDCNNSCTYTIPN